MDIGVTGQLEHRPPPRHCGAQAAFPARHAGDPFQSSRARPRPHGSSSLGCALLGKPAVTPGVRGGFAATPGHAYWRGRRIAPTCRVRRAQRVTPRPLTSFSARRHLPPPFGQRTSILPESPKVAFRSAKVPLSVANWHVREVGTTVAFYRAQCLPRWTDPCTLRGSFLLTWSTQLGFSATAPRPSSYPPDPREPWPYTDARFGQGPSVLPGLPRVAFRGAKGETNGWPSP